MSTNRLKARQLLAAKILEDVHDVAFAVKASEGESLESYTDEKLQYLFRVCDQQQKVLYNLSLCVRDLLCLCEGGNPDVVMGPDGEVPTLLSEPTDTDEDPLHPSGDERDRDSNPDNKQPVG